MNQKAYVEIQQWMHRNARELELCLWKYFFENGDQAAVIDALMSYQNEDGGFGHALEADNWNPSSTPITTQHAIKIMKMVDFLDMNHPIYQGIFRYLESEKDLNEYGWSFTVPSNDKYPHAPWWDYSEEDNKKEYYGITAELASFILTYGTKNTSLYQKAETFRDELFEQLTCSSSFGDMGISGMITLFETSKILSDSKNDLNKVEELLDEKVKNSIERDTTKWKFYGTRPSKYITSPNSPYYEANKEIVLKELEYEIENRPENDVWNITWTWFNHMDEYGPQFAVSQNWWKGFCVIEKMLFLRNFGKLED